MPLRSLLSWCAQNDFFIDPRISICRDKDRGIHVGSKDSSIPSNITLARIPKYAVLSVKSCTISEHIPFELHGLGAQLGLSFALYSELLRGESSRWFGYLHSLTLVDLPVFWDSGTTEKLNGTARMADSELEPLQWLRGTVVLNHLNKRTESGLTLLETIDRYYNELVLLVLQRPYVRCLIQGTPNLTGFRHAFALVSSRAFLLDAYHGLAMTPVADAFNHVLENHVHIQSDFYVCPECGSLRECEHDDEQHNQALKSLEEDGDNDLYYEMVSNAEIKPHEEVFNTYGENLSNAQLLLQYGFILDPNDNDMVHFDVADVIGLFAPQHADMDAPPKDVDSTTFTELFASSNLIFVNESLELEAQFSIDSDGKISHSLWIFLLKLLWTNESSLPWPTEDEMMSVVLTQIRLEALVQEDRSVPEEETIDETQVQTSPWVTVLQNLAREVVQLCEAKKKTIGHPNYVKEDLGDILDAMPEDRNRTRLALSIVMSERSILDSCRYGWLDFIDRLVVAME